MAGSLNHIVDDLGSFTMNYIENLGDANEALSECHQIIAALLYKACPNSAEEQAALLQSVCDAMSFPRPEAAPTLDEELWGAAENRIGIL